MSDTDLTKPWSALRDEMTDEQRLHIEVVLDPKTAAGLLTHAAELIEKSPTCIEPENRRWLQDFTDFRDVR